MRVLVQRVKTAWVSFAEGGETPRSGGGLLCLVGFEERDGTPLLSPMAYKLVNLRIFDDREGKMNRSLLDSGGDLTLVSQFTLYADCRKGRRPSFVHAMPPGRAEPMYEAFVAMCRRHVPRAASRRFGEAMAVHLVNDGPVTILLDSGELQMAAGA